MNNAGFFYALLAYLIWGIVPLFWRELEHVPSTEIVAHRMVWSCLMVLLFIVLMREWRQMMGLLQKPDVLLRLLAASILISINWAIYIWAVNNGQIVEGSMGYYINPLLNVLFGVCFFGETLRPRQLMAVLLAALGVAYLIFVHDQVPYVALSLALTFSCYGAVKKTISTSATHGMAIETGLLILPAIGYLIYLHMSGLGSSGIELRTDAMLALGGLVTLTPLVLFAMAAQRISMTALGMTQYLGPSLQLLIGVMVFQEPFGTDRQIAFGLIWMALAIYSLDQFFNQRKRRLAINPAP